MNNQNLKSIKDNNTYNNIMNTTFEETLENLPISTEQLFESLGETALELIGEYLDTPEEENEYFIHRGEKFKVIETKLYKNGKVKSKIVLSIGRGITDEEENTTVEISLGRKSKMWFEKGKKSHYEFKPLLEHEGIFSFNNVEYRKEGIIVKYRNGWRFYWSPALEISRGKYFKILEEAQMFQKEWIKNIPY